MFISVDFPEPEGPITATYSPWLMVIEMPRNASNEIRPLEYVLRMSSIAMTGRAVPIAEVPITAFRRCGRCHPD
ncbi:MAG TPA: hypothetical protein VGX45_04845 [Solirubrobacteraceae bacterium]|nr:hypothetical protein [Solirubrobacteraceae bacterium]